MGREATADVVIRSRQKGKQVYDRLQRQIGALTKGVAILGATAIGGGVAGLSALTKRSFESADALAKQADRMGESTTRLKALQNLTELYGGSSGNLTKSLIKAQKALGEFNATGSGTAAPFLRKLNLDTKALAELKPGELFEEYAEQIRNMGTRAEQTAASALLFGDRTGEMLNIIDAGPDAFREIEEEVIRYGIALDRVDSAKIEAANDAMFRVRERMTGVGNVIATRVAPLVTAMANRFLDTGKEADEMGAIVDKVMNGIATGAGVVADVLFGWQLLFQAIRIGALDFGAALVGSLAKVERAVIVVQNKMADAFGGDLADVRGGFLTGIEDSLRASSEHASDVLQELAATEKPSERLAEFMAKAREEAENVAVATAEARKQIAAIEDPTAGATVDDERAREQLEREEQRLRDGLQRKIEIIEASLRTEEETEIFAFERRMEILENAFDRELLSVERKLELEAQLEEQHQARLNKITLKGLTDRQKFEAKSGKDRTKQVFGDLENISAGVATHNKALFRLNQASAIANAVINTHEGVTKSLSAYPMPLAAVMAAAHLAAGVAQIGAIRSAQFGGGSTPSAIGTTPTINDFPVDQLPSDQNTDTAPGSQITIIVEGNLIGDEGVRQVVGDTLRDLVDSDEILIDPDSRQAIEIREGNGSGG